MGFLVVERMFDILYINLYDGFAFLMLKEIMCIYLKDVFTETNASVEALVARTSP